MHVFISHAPSDKATAEQIAEELRKQSLEVWNPELEVFPGDNWGRKTGEALEAADALVVLMSPDAVKSPWVLREIEYALGEKRFKGRVFTALVRPTPQDDVPWVLRKLNWVDLTLDSSRGAASLARMVGMTAPHESHGAV